MHARDVPGQGVMIPSRMGRNSYLPWRNEGGPSTWPLVLLADRGVTLVGSKVSAWADVVTGNGKSVVQITDSAQPTWTTSDAKYAGRSSLTGGSGIIMSSAAFTLAQPFSVCWYGWSQNTGGPVQVAVSSDSTVRGTGYNIMGQSWMNAIFDVNRDGGPSNDGLCHACVAVFNGASSMFYWDDATVVQGNVGSGTITSGISVLA